MDAEAVQSGSHAAFIVAIVPLAIMAFALWWCLVVWLVSRVTGWHKLARQFSADRPPEAPDFKWCSLRFSAMSSYGKCLRVTLAKAGIFIQPAWMFRMGHPALLIPWKYAGALQERKIVFTTRHFLPLELEGRTLKLELPESARGAVDKYRGKSENGR